MNMKLGKFLLWTGLGASAAWLCVVQAQQGDKPPAPMSDAAGHVRQDAYIMPAVPAADRAYEKIDGHKIKEKDLEVVAISHKSRDAGDKYWGRIAGTKYEKMTAEWAEGKWKQAGLTDIHEQEYPLPPQWFGIDWNVTASGSGKTLTFKSLNPSVGSVSTPPGGLEAEAVWVGLGTAADFMGRDVRGKVVLIMSILEPGNMGESAGWEGAWKRAADLGAAAIFTIWGYNDNMAVWQGISGGRGNPIKVPGFFLGYEDGKALRELISQGNPVKVKMNLKTETRENLKAVAAYGTLPGTTDENIYVLAHTDGYYEAALDNASGLAVMTTLAEYFSQIPKEKRRRSITFVASSGHHAGSPTTQYMHDHRDTMLNKTVLILNCEHVSHTDLLQWSTHLRASNAIQERRWWVNGSNRLMDIAQKAFLEFGVNLVAEMDPNASGDMGHIERDAPSIQVIDSPELKHTDWDIPERVPDAGLAAVARAYAKIIDEVNKLDRKDVLPNPMRSQR
jgi:peptidase M28-like protein